MELTDFKSAIVFNLKKIIVVRNKMKGGGMIKGKLHKITACEVAFQCADPGTVFRRCRDISQQYNFCRAAQIICRKGYLQY